MSFFPTKRSLTQKQIDNIRKAVDYMLRLFDCCPDLGRDPYIAEIFKKLRELTANDDAIRENFGSDDPFLDEHNAQGWTQKFFRVFWNQYILIHTMILPNRDLDETNCNDKAI